MGWLKGLEPSSTGATIRRVNRFTTATTTANITTKSIITQPFAWSQSFYISSLWHLQNKPTSHKWRNLLYQINIKLATIKYSNKYYFNMFSFHFLNLYRIYFNFSIFLLHSLQQKIADSYQNISIKKAMDHILFQ